MKISEMITDRYKLRIPPTVYYDLLADVQEMEDEQRPKFIAKSDGTIEQIKNCNDCLFKKEWEKIGKLLSVVLEKQTEQEPTTKNDLGVDCVSREKVLKLIYDYKENHSNDREHYPINYGTLLDMIRWVRDLPSVTPQEPKTGHWYRQTNDFVDYYECSECGMAIGLYDVKNYCPNCGSRNEVEE